MPKISFKMEKQIKPFGIVGRIILSDFSQDTQGNFYLSPEIMHYDEVDQCVDFLIMQLEDIRKDMKVQFKK